MEDQHSFYTKFSRREISDKRRAAAKAAVRATLVRIVERKDGWWAVYSDGLEYRHDTEQECKQLHPRRT